MNREGAQPDLDCDDDAMTEQDAGQLNDEERNDACRAWS